MTIDGKPFVTVVVPVFDRAEQLDRVLTALDLQTWPADRYEVVFVDNGSPNAAEFSVDPCARERVFVLHENTPGAYAARNRGIEAARGEIIAFTDADCVPEPNWIARGVSRFTDTQNCGFVAGRIELLFRDPERLTAVELYESVAAHRQQEYVERWRFGATANLFTSRKVIEDVGPFDDGLKSLGDLDWGWRVAASGYRLVYDDAVRVRHPARRALGDFRKRSARIAGGFCDLARRNRHGLGAPVCSASIGLAPVRRLVGSGEAGELTGIGRRLKVTAVLAYLVTVRLFELVRVSLGGESGR